MNMINYEKQKLKILEMELEVEKQKLELMKLELDLNQTVVDSSENIPTNNINFCKTNSKLYQIGRVTSNGVIYTKTGYRLKLNIKELIKLQNQLPSLLKKGKTPRFWEIIGKKYNVSSNCIERIIYNLVNGTFDNVISNWNNYHIQYNQYGNITGGK